MDLSLNFAAEEPSASSSLSRPTVKAAKGGRWTDRMKASQQARKQVKSAASTSSSRQNSGSTGSKKVRKETNNQTPRQSAQDQAELPVKKLQTDSKKSGKLRERTTNDTVSHQDHDAAPVTAGPAAKRQVISSLFSNPQKVTPSESGQRHDVSDSTTLLTPSNAPSLADSFADMDIPPEIVAHITGKMSLSNPTTIQKLAVPFLCNPESSKKDALLQAQTGSGKTLAYLIPIIQDLCRLSEHFANLGKPIERNVGTMAIILVPTRELANQIFEVASKLLGFSSQAKASHRWITPGLLTGGAHRQHEKARLRKGVPLLIATPGRLLDHLETTKAFRIAGESIRHSADVPRPKRKLEAQDSDEEFAYEDQETSHVAGDAEDGYISSDEDFESMARSRSHRTTAAAAARQSSKIVPPEDPLLALRWLVLDEADRLMDMGFEPQICSIVQLLETRLDIRKAKAVKAANRGAVTHRLNGKAPEQAQMAGRRTILCSATVEENVQKLAGIALREPLLIKGDDRGDSAPGAGTTATKYAPPSQLAQKYATVPPKLRFVTLVALLRQTLLAQSSQGMKQKVLVFMSCTDAVDFAWTALGGLKMGRTEADDASKSERKSKDTNGLAGNSSLLPGTPIYRLHGSLDLRTRLSSLKNFASSAADCSVLLCTSVAGRGLDVENVSCVIQYDLPTEGGVNEYIHRVGRTARAGTAGQAWAFLMPNEVGWVDWAKAGMTQLTETVQHGVSLQESEVSDILRAGFGGGKDTLDYETRATDVQMAYERWVVSDEANTRLAKKAFASHIRAYATHPSEEKQFFHVKSLHLGHLAKAFGLREAPAGIGGGGGASKHVSEPKLQQTVGRKKRKAEELVESAPPVDNNVNKRPAIPRSGRALNGKGLRGPKATVRDDFNIASTDALASMLVSKRKK